MVRQHRFCCVLHAAMSCYRSRFSSCPCVLFFFTDTPNTEIYTLSLHDALPISPVMNMSLLVAYPHTFIPTASVPLSPRSEEHTSELQSLRHLVCRLLLEKKKNRYRRRADRHRCRTPQYRSAAHR